MLRFLSAALFALFCAASGFAQQNPRPQIPAQTASAKIVRGTPAYAEVLLRRTDLESTLEDLLVAYTEDFPKVKQTRFELDLVQKDLDRLLAMGEAQASKMTLALGKLLVRRAQLKADLEFLKIQYSDTHPDVQRARRRVDSFEKAIGEIMQ